MWFNANLKAYAGDVARHGAGLQLPPDHLHVRRGHLGNGSRQRGEHGHANVAEMIASFKRPDMRQTSTAYEPHGPVCI